MKRMRGGGAARMSPMQKAKDLAAANPGARHYTQRRPGNPQLSPRQTMASRGLPPTGARQLPVRGQTRVGNPQLAPRGTTPPQGGLQQALQQPGMRGQPMSPMQKAKLIAQQKQGMRGQGVQPGGRMLQQSPVRQSSPRPSGALQRAIQSRGAMRMPNMRGSRRRNV